jgi:PIN domain nuclease of toxin-antitoxin system
MGEQSGKMNAPLLLDTCAVIWIANDDPIAQGVSDTMQEAIRAGEPVFVLPITAWELGCSFRVTG